MVETIGGSLVVVLVIPVIIAVGFAVGYLSLRVRDSRAETPDPELGIKSAYHAFMTTGILLALTGLTMSATDFLSEWIGDKQRNQPQFGPQAKFGPQQGFRQPQRDDNPLDRVSQRVAWPLVISGCLFSLVSLLLIVAGTNDKRYPAVRRTFGGLRLMVEGLAAMAGVTLVVELLFQKDPFDMQPFSIAIALIAIWFPAAAIQVFLLKIWGKQPYYVPPKSKNERPAEIVDAEEDEPDEQPRPRDRRRPPRLPREEE